jgi:septum formation protein
MPSGLDEIFDLAMTPPENAMRLAHAKAVDVARKVEEGIVVGADTIVVLDGEYLGKPSNHSDAVRMLGLLSGRTHAVVTGISIVDRPTNKSVTEHEKTSVTFREIPSEEIEMYVSQGSPMDKAGAYGIQDDYGAVFVSRIEGCYYNVVGLPVSRFHRMLQEFSKQLDEH